MEVSVVEARLVNASIYIKNAILELKNISCECAKGETCWRCYLIEDTKNLRDYINDEISERFL